MQEYQDAGIPRCRNTKMQEYQDAGIPRCRNTMQGSRLIHFLFILIDRRGNARSKTALYNVMKSLNASFRKYY